MTGHPGARNESQRQRNGGLVSSALVIGCLTIPQTQHAAEVIVRTAVQTTGGVAYLGWTAYNISYTQS